ncbi:MAG: radical SAM protein [Candidatus Lokiarchaeota archaeon]|nr:radical SAM protein [Candidatus Lokiarchaeota archaeon]
MVIYELKEFKTVINKMKFVDSWFWCRYTLNSYNGCEHACVYCDARSKKYYLHPEFEEVIFVKTNIRKKLDDRLRRARTLLPDVVGTGGTCDAYQQAEKQYKNTRQVLEVLLKYKFPVLIGTKNTLVLRDLDLITQINKETWCTVAFTITSFNEEVINFLEPRASPPDERINALRMIKEEHPEIQTGVHFMPIVPLLEDSDDNLEEVVSRTKEAKCDFILFAPGMSLRDDQAEFFKKKLKEKYPAIYDEFLSLYRTGSMWGNPEYLSVINKKVYNLCKKYNINFRSKRWIPNDFRRVNYIIAEKLLNESYELEVLEKPDKQMQWAGLNIQNLNDSLLNIKNYKEVLKIPNYLVDKIDRMLKNFKRKKDLTSYF